MMVSKINPTTIGNWRLFNPKTGRYLGLSGNNETTSTSYAWRGTKDQANNVRNHLGFTPTDWPYYPIGAVGPNLNHGNMDAVE